MNAHAAAVELSPVEPTSPSEEIGISAAELQMIYSGEAIVNNF